MISIIKKIKDSLKIGSSTINELVSPLRDQKELEEIERLFKHAQHDVNFRFSEYLHDGIALWEKYGLGHQFHQVSTKCLSGYIREKHLKYLIDHYQKGDEEWILLRLSDWVPEVSRHAEKWVSHNVVSISLKQLSESWKVIHFLSRKKNCPGYNTISSVVKSKVSSREDYESWKLFPLLFRRLIYSLIDSPELLREWYTIETSPANRLQIVRNLYVQNENLLEYLNDSYYQIRYEILKKVSLTQKEIEPFLFDKSSKVRSLAQYISKKNWGVDCYSLYEQRTDEFRFFTLDFIDQVSSDIIIAGLEHHKQHVRIQSVKAAVFKDIKLLNNNIETHLKDCSYIRMKVLKHIHELVTIEKYRSLKELISRGKPYSEPYLVSLSSFSYWEYLIEYFTLLDQGIVLNSELIRKSQIFERITETQKEDLLPLVQKLRSNDLSLIQMIHNA